MIRIAANFARLASTFIMGVAVVRLMAEIGQPALVFYLLLVAGNGIVMLFSGAMRESIVPILGLSYGERSERDFPEVYWTAFVTGLISGLLSVVLFAGLWSLSGSFNVAEIGLKTVAIALTCSALQTIVSSATTPFISAILIDGRIVAYNVLLMLERAIDLAAAIGAWALPDSVGLETRIVIYYVATMGLTSLLQIGTYWLAVRGNAAFRMRPMPIRSSNLGWISRIFSWNVVLVLAFMLYARFTTFAVNFGLGEAATVSIGLALTLIGYQRQLSMGLVIGLDAAVSRHFSQADDHGPAQTKTLILRSTYVQSVFGAVSIAALMLYADNIFTFWLGRSLDPSEWDPDLAVLVFRVMSVGIAARTVSEVWMKFLAGRGEVSAYAPWVLGGGMVNAAVVVWVILTRPEASAIFWAAIAYTILHMLIHIGVMGALTAKRLGVNFGQMSALIVPPFVLVGLGIWGSVLALGGAGSLIAVVGNLVALGLTGLVALLLLPRVMSVAQ